MLAQGFLRVKGQANITKCYFLWVGGINMQSLSDHYLMRQTVPMLFFTSFSLSWYCCLRFCRNKFGLILAQGYFKGQRSSIIHKFQLFITLCDMQSLSGHYLMRHQVPTGVFTSLVYLSAVAYNSVEISLGSCWYRDILRVKDQGFITNCNFLWLCEIWNHQVVTTRCAIKYPWCFYFF